MQPQLSISIFYSHGHLQYSFERLVKQKGVICVIKVTIIIEYMWPTFGILTHFTPYY